MKSKKIIILIVFILAIIGIIALISTSKDDEELSDYQTLQGTIIAINDNYITIQNRNNSIYTIKINETRQKLLPGTDIIIEYTGVLNEINDLQDITVIEYGIEDELETNILPNNWDDEGLFKNYYKLAADKVKTMTIDEKIGQLFIVRYPNYTPIEDIKNYHLGGFTFYTKDFKDKTKNEVIDMISNLQKASTIPLITSVDEEGGSIIRISSNNKLVTSPFKSPQELYNLGGFQAIKDDTIYKSSVLKELGINLNLAPVVDVSTNPSDYIYSRTLGQNTELTSEYAKTVIKSSLNSGVSYTLKHFPGYNNNTDTHNGISIDNRSLEEIRTTDFPTFQAGINESAEAVLVNHNIISSVDNQNPATLSRAVHNILRNELNFSGIIMTDSMDMQAITGIDNSVVKAILAGNDLILTTDYKNDIANVKTAIENNIINEETINKAAFRVIAWKYYKGLIYENNKS